MAITLETLPDEILTMVMDAILEPAKQPWPYSRNNTPLYAEHCRPAIAALNLTSKRLRAVAKPYRYYCTTVIATPKDLEQLAEAVQETRLLDLGPAVGTSDWNQGKGVREALSNVPLLEHLYAAINNRGQAILAADCARRAPRLQYLDVNFGPTDRDQRQGLQNIFFRSLLGLHTGKSLRSRRVPKGSDFGDYPRPLRSFTIRGRLLFEAQESALFQRFVVLSQLQDLELYGINFDAQEAQYDSLAQVKRLALNGPLSGTLQHIFPCLTRAVSLKEFWLKGCHLSYDEPEQLLAALPASIHTLGFCCVATPLFQAFMDEVIYKESMMHVHNVHIVDTLRHFALEDYARMFATFYEDCETFDSCILDEDTRDGTITPMDWLEELQTVGHAKYGKRWIWYLPKDIIEDLRETMDDIPDYDSDSKSVLSVEGA